jgi:hypothetical protein
LLRKSKGLVVRTDFDAKGSIYLMKELEIGLSKIVPLARFKENNPITIRLESAEEVMYPDGTLASTSIDVRSTFCSVLYHHVSYAL